MASNLTIRKPGRIKRTRDAVEFTVNGETVIVWVTDLAASEVLVITPERRIPITMTPRYGMVLVSV